MGLRSMVSMTDQPSSRYASNALQNNNHRSLLMPRSTPSIRVARQYDWYFLMMDEVDKDSDALPATRRAIGCLDVSCRAWRADACWPHQIAHRGETRTRRKSRGSAQDTGAGNGMIWRRRAVDSSQLLEQMNLPCAIPPRETFCHAYDACIRA